MARIPNVSFSRTKEDEGDLQLLAGISLLHSTGLIRWDYGKHAFSKGDDLASFDKRWHSMNPAFGRVIIWHTFGTGAEYFLKGLMLLNRTEVRFVEEKNGERKGKLAAPSTGEADLESWADSFFAMPQNPPTEDAVNFGDLGSIVGDTAKFRALHETYRSTTLDGIEGDKEARLAYAAMSLLRDSIRNRDAHAYIPNVRNENFGLVTPVYLRAFNFLLTWIPTSHRGKILSERLAAPDLYIRGLKPTIEVI